MKRYAKKGPRRSRAMPVSTKRFVVTDYDGQGYIMAGRNYSVVGKCGNLVDIVSSTGPSTIVSPDCGRGCAHLNGRKWRWATL